MTLPTTSQSRAGIDLNAFLAVHANDLIVLLLVATAITVGHWRYWFYPDDMSLKDGSLDPRAGTVNLHRVIGDFLFMPTGIVCGTLALGLGWGAAIACAVVVFVVFVGSAFLMATFEKARDGALGVFLQVLTNWVPGGKK